MTSDSKQLFHTSRIMQVLFRAECMRTEVVRALVEVVATKLGIILHLFLFPSTYFSPRRGLRTILKFYMPY